MDYDVLACGFSNGNFLRAAHTDLHVVGIPDVAKPFMWNNGLGNLMNSIIGCGQCYKFHYKPTGQYAVAVGADYCYGCNSGSGHDFDLSDALFYQLVGSFNDNIHYPDLEVTPVAYLHELTLVVIGAKIFVMFWILVPIL